jgi:hypothetical protein
MTVVAKGGIDEAQRIRLGISDLAIAMDRDTNRLLSYVNICEGHGDSRTVRHPTAFPHASLLRHYPLTPPTSQALRECPLCASRQPLPTNTCTSVNAFNLLLSSFFHHERRVKAGLRRLSLCSPVAYRNVQECVQVDVDTTFFSERDSLSLRYDLMDTGIYICAPEVLLLFSDNFDFQHIQRDFIRGVLSEEELGNKLFVHELRNTYAAQVVNLRSYAAVSLDIMSRWLRPLHPDANLLPATEAPDIGPDFVSSQRCVCAPTLPLPCAFSHALLIVTVVRRTVASIRVHAR